jgi:hypothetical protein
MEEQTLDFHFCSIRESNYLVSIPREEKLLVRIGPALFLYAELAQLISGSAGAYLLVRVSFLKKKKGPRVKVAAAQEGFDMIRSEVQL